MLKTKLAGGDHLPDLAFEIRSEARTILDRDEQLVPIRHGHGFAQMPETRIQPGHCADHGLFENGKPVARRHRQQDIVDGAQLVCAWGQFAERKAAQFAQQKIALHIVFEDRKQLA